MQLLVDEFWVCGFLAFWSLALIAVTLAYSEKASLTKSARPRVTAFVSRHRGGSASPFNLIVANNGDQLAVRVRLQAAYCEIKERATNIRFKTAEFNFIRERNIPTLQVGEELTTSFDAPAGDWPQGFGIQFGLRAVITINYEDAEGREFSSVLPLKICARERRALAATVE